MKVDDGIGERESSEAGEPTLAAPTKPSRDIRAAGLLVVLFILAVARPAAADWVIAGFLGTAATTRTWLTLEQPASGTNVRFDEVDFKGYSFDRPLYYGVRAGYFLPSPGWLGVEGEFVHMKVFAQTGQVVPAQGTIGGLPVSGRISMDSLVQRFSLSHGQNLILINAVARHALGECGDWRTARVTVAARLGAGPTVPHVETMIGGTADERYERGAWVLQVAGGVELRLFRGVHALAEYKFTRCLQSVAVANGGTARTLLHSHHVVFGASYHF